MLITSSRKSALDKLATCSERFLCEAIVREAVCNEERSTFNGARAADLGCQVLIAFGLMATLVDETDLADALQERSFWRLLDQPDHGPVLLEFGSARRFCLTTGSKRSREPSGPLLWLKASANDQGLSFKDLCWQATSWEVYASDAQEHQESCKPGSIEQSIILPRELQILDQQHCIEPTDSPQPLHKASQFLPDGNCDVLNIQNQNHSDQHRSSPEHQPIYIEARHTPVSEITLPQRNATHRLNITSPQNATISSTSILIQIDKQTQKSYADSMIDEVILSSGRCRFEERPCPHTELPPSRPVRSASSTLQHSQSTTHMHCDNQAELLVSTARHKTGNLGSQFNVSIKQRALNRQIKKIDHCTRSENVNVTETPLIRRTRAVSDTLDGQFQSISQRIVSSGLDCSSKQYHTRGSPSFEELLSERLRTQQLCKELRETRKQLFLIEETRLASKAAMHSLQKKGNSSPGSDLTDDETIDDMLPPEPEQLPAVTKLWKCLSQRNLPSGAGRRWQRHNSMPSLKHVPEVNRLVAACSNEATALEQTGSHVAEHGPPATVPKALREARRAFVHAQLARLAFEGGA